MREVGGVLTQAEPSEHNHVTFLCQQQQASVSIRIIYLRRIPSSTFQSNVYTSADSSRICWPVFTISLLLSKLPSTFLERNSVSELYLQIYLHPGAKRICSLRRNVLPHHVCGPCSDISGCEAWRLQATCMPRTGRLNCVMLPMATSSKAGSPPGWSRLCLELLHFLWGFETLWVFLPK